MNNNLWGRLGGRLAGRCGRTIGLASMTMVACAAAQASAMPPDPTALPEPATLALVSIGAAGVAMIRRRRK